MAKLIIDYVGEDNGLEDIASAVYCTLGQTFLLKAELVYMSAEKMRELNNQTRGIDSVTDVLSYPTLDGVRGKVLDGKDYPTDLDGDELFIGSIVLCEDKIKEQAEEYGHSFEREKTYLIVHGLMHLFGYDHMTDEDKIEMRDMEKRALARLGVND